MGSALAGKAAIITGGASGIGRVMVDAYLEEGARVVIADVDAERGAAAAAETGAVFRRADVAEPDDVRDLVAFTAQTLGGLHVMVNNAGVPTAMHARFLDDDLADFHRVMDVDLLGVMLGTRHAARHMRDHGGGSIINITSIAGVQAGCAEMTYRAAKAGVIHFSKSVAIDLAEYGIRVNCVAPGAIRTPILSTATAHLPQNEEVAHRLRDVMAEMRPLNREGTGEDIAAAAIYLAGEGARYVTGTLLPVDGGMTAGYPGNALAEIMETLQGHG